MSNPDLYTGKLVRLSIDDPSVIAEAFARWERDSEYLRLLDSSVRIPISIKKMTEWLEKDLAKDPPSDYFFLIRSLEKDQIIGFVGFDGHIIPHGECWVGIGIGERELWGRGYGTDAMRLILRYGFTELNLRRVSLGTFGYNLRAIRSYEKAGFVYEGRVRQELKRGGQRWDVIIMGILRQEWLAQNPHS